MAAPLGAAAAAAARAAAIRAAKKAAARAATEKITKGGWFQKVPREILFSPGGVILIFLALIIEAIDLIPIPLLDQIIELPLEIIFLVLFVIIVKPSFKSLIIPFFIERIPVINDILPTWLIKMFGFF